MTHTPKRPWFRFSLRTLFVTMTVFGIAAGWVAWNLHQVRQRQWLVEFISSNVGMYTIGERPNRGALPALYVEPHGATGTVPLSWRLLGAKPIKSPALREWVVFTPNDLQRARLLLPEVEVTIVPYMPERSRLPPPYDKELTRVVNPFVE